MAKYAVIEVGTNSIKFHIAEKDAEGRWSVVLDTSEISRLGSGMQATGDISLAAMARNVNVIAEMIKVTREQGIDQVVAVGTMCLRTAKNAQEFVQRVKQKCSVTIEVISGEEEARLAYLAVKSGIGLKRGKLVIFDTGGGSTEFIFGRDEQIEKRLSVNVGAVRYTEQILVSDPVTQKEFDQAVAAIEHDFAGIQFDGNVKKLIGIGGGVTNLLAVRHQRAVYDPELIHGSTLELAEIDRQIDLYRSKTIAERRKIVGLQPERADVILAGAVIVRVIMKKAAVDSITVCDRGVRHGLILDRFNC
jgi:exopolyphosphatase/guanosine-5'-triphosphate,3'-diphosphate pyrophosphatase